MQQWRLKALCWRFGQLNSGSKNPDPAPTTASIAPASDPEPARSNAEKRLDRRCIRPAMTPARLPAPNPGCQGPRASQEPASRRIGCPGPAIRGRRRPVQHLQEPAGIASHQGRMSRNRPVFGIYCRKTAANFRKAAKPGRFSRRRHGRSGWPATPSMPILELNSTFDNMMILTLKITTK